MGISLSTARLLIRESKRKSFNGCVLQLGRQNISFNESSLKTLSLSENYNPAQNVGIGVRDKENDLKGQYIDDITFFRFLGLSIIDSLDINSFEGANVLHDLNKPIFSESESFSKYDLIYDGGTMEHVFHVPNLLANCINLVKVGGRIIHSVPIDMFNHGFYNFSSTLFEDYYSVNNLEINYILVTKSPNYSLAGSCYCANASRGSQFIRSLYQGTFDGAVHNLFVVATKTELSTANAIPMQGYYQDLFNKRENLNNSGLVVGNSTMKYLYQISRGIPIISLLVKMLRNYYARFSVKWHRI